MPRHQRNGNTQRPSRAARRRLAQRNAERAAMRWSQPRKRKQTAEFGDLTEPPDPRACRGLHGNHCPNPVKLPYHTHCPQCHTEIRVATEARPQVGGGPGGNGIEARHADDPATAVHTSGVRRVG